MSALEDAQKQQVLLQAQKAQGNLSVFGTELPPPPEREPGLMEAGVGGMGVTAAGTLAAYMANPKLALKAIDDQMRSIASGATASFSDEAAAGLAALLGKGTYEENVAAERARDVSIPEHQRLPGEVAGGLATGNLLAKGGVSLLAGAKPTVASLAARGAGEGAAYGAAYGAGTGEGAEGKIGGALTGAATGALTGGFTGAFAGLFSRGGAATTESVRKEANKAFANAEKAGLEVTEQSFRNASGEIFAAAKKAGIDKDIHPKAWAALNRLVGESGPKTLNDISVLRRVMKATSASTEPDERRIAAIMIDKLDDYFVGLKSVDVVSGDRVLASKSLTEARSLWTRYKKGEAISEAIERAGTRAGQFSGSGYENALRTEFRSIAMNTRRMRTFTQKERVLIKKVASGGPVENALRLLGKLAPRGIISATLGGGVGYGLGGPVGSAAVMGVGEAGRFGATAMTKASANAALERMLTGKGPVTLTREQANILRSAIIGEQAAQ